MEQFDVNGLPSYSWLPAYAETEENNLNRSSRNILETILEETSDEEGLQDVWPLYDENSCSSECESVIRVELLQDQDTISERDYICPAKRRKQENSELFTFEKAFKKKIIHVEKLNDIFSDQMVSLEKRPDQRLRFDELGHDIYSESDLSFTSLSRTSSLTLFESLERQLQSENQHSGSLPSICSIQPQFELQKNSFIEENSYSSEDSSSNSDTKTCVSFGALNGNTYQSARDGPKDISYFNGAFGNFNDNLEVEHFPQSNGLRAKSGSTPNIKATFDTYLKDYGEKNTRRNEYNDTDEFYNSEWNEKTMIYKEDLSPNENSFFGANEESFTKSPFNVISVSSPDIKSFNNDDFFEQYAINGSVKNCHYIRRKMEMDEDSSFDFLLISSVPENMNLCCEIPANEKYNNSNQQMYDLETNISFDIQKSISPKKNLNVDKKFAQKLSHKSNPYLKEPRNWNNKTASYANLTMTSLYSDEQYYGENLKMEEYMNDYKNSLNSTKYGSNKIELDLLLDGITSFSHCLDEPNIQELDFNFQVNSVKDFIPENQLPIRKRLEPNDVENKIPTIIQEAVEMPTENVTLNCVTQPSKIMNIKVNANYKSSKIIQSSRPLVGSAPNLCYFHPNFLDTATTVPKAKNVNVHQSLMELSINFLADETKPGMNKNSFQPIKTISFNPIVSEIIWKDSRNHIKTEVESVKNLICTPPLKKQNVEQPQALSRTVLLEKPINCSDKLEKKLNVEPVLIADNNEKRENLKNRVIENCFKTFRDEKFPDPDSNFINKNYIQRSNLVIKKKDNVLNNKQLEIENKFCKLNGKLLARSEVKSEEICKKRVYRENEKEKRGFLSRLSSGLRFSFRKRSKKNKKNFTNEQTSMKLEVNNSFEANHPNLALNITSEVQISIQDLKTTTSPILKPSENVVHSEHQEYYKNRSSTNATKTLDNALNENSHFIQSINQQRIHEYKSKVHTPSALINSSKLNQSYIQRTSSPPQIRKSYVNNNKIRYSLPTKVYCSSVLIEKKTGLIETNLDTDETVVTGKTRSLVELGLTDQTLENYNEEQLSSMNNKHQRKRMGRRTHKSMEFLLDKENLICALPPENELQKSHDNKTTLSEHQLRVQASLQKLNIPDWYKQYKSTNHNTTQPQSSCIIKKKSSEIGRWTGLNSKTTSLSSLGSRCDKSPIILSPSAYSHQSQPGFSRWSTLCLNTNQISPSVSTRSSFSRSTLNASNSSYAAVPRVKQSNAKHNSTRQPYLGWRSQEKVSQPRTPAERLASTMLIEPRRLQPQDPPAVTYEIQTSIKEVTSAIVHHFDKTSQSSRSRSVSPSSRACWLESSFVGTRCIESPDTPTITTKSPTVSQRSSNNKIQQHTSEKTINSRVEKNAPTLTLTSDRQSTSSATLEDVLASLLGLPHNHSGNALSNNLSQLHVEKSNNIRRHSESNAQTQNANHTNQQNGTSVKHHRRISCDAGELKTQQKLIFCRNPNCRNTATFLVAKNTYKSCQNCSNLYCSRDCRRLDIKHRNSCLHIHFSVLCRHILSTCKDDSNTLNFLSLLALRGFASNGRGVIRILFRNSESANQFIKNGDVLKTSEVTYVRWMDLLPGEMGPELYQELLKISIEYNPFKKMLLYVAICIVSGSINTQQLDRQLVSRCAKLKLCKTILNDLNIPSSSTVEKDHINMNAKEKIKKKA